MLYEQLAPGTVRWGWRLRGYCEHDDRRGVTARLQRVAHAHAHAHAVGGADTGAGGEGGAGGAGGEGGEGGEVYSEVYIWGGDRCSVGAQLPVAISPYISVYLPGSPYLRISPYISAYLPISPHISLYLRISPYTSAYFRIPPHISLYLRISPRISQARSSPWRSWRVAACSARAPRSRGAC